MENKRIFGFRKIAGVLVACAIGVSVYTDASAQDQNSIIYQTMGGQEIEITVPWEFEEGVDEESVDLSDNPFFTGDEDVREDTASSYISNLGEEQTYMENHLNTINSVREERGLEPLQLDEELIKLAQIKAADMVENQYFDHDRPGTGSIGQQYSYFLTEPGDKNPENFSVSIAMFSSDSNDPDAVQEEIYDLLTDDNGLSNSITSDYYNSFGVAFYHDEENDIYFGVQLFHTDPVEDEDAPDNGEDVPEDGEETDDNGEDTPEDGEETDDNGEDVPEDGEETDDNGDDTPEDGEDIEDNGDDTPEDGEDTEDNGEDTPEDGQDFTRADAVINYSHVERTLEFQDQENVQGIQLFTSLNGEPVDIFNASDVSDTLNFSLPFDGFEVDRVYHERLGHDITFETTTDDAGNQVIQIRTPDLDNEDYIFLVQTATENPLADAITAATETVNGLENLSDEQRQQFKSQIESAESEEAINTIVSEAQAADDSAAPDPLADVKTAAVETVNGLEFLSDEQTQEFLTQIETAESEEAINSIVSEAQAANSENDSSFEYADINLRYQFLDLTFNQYDDREYQTIELVPTVDEEAVNPFDASDVDDTYTFNIRFDEFPVTDILNVDNANPIPFEVVDSDDGQVLEVTINSMSRLLLLGDEIDQFASIRESARSQVAELVNLNEEQVAEFNTQIDEAETEDAINAVVSDARSLNEEQTPDPLADDKNAAKETVGALEHLNEEQVSAFNTQIDDAESVDAINAVVSEAEAANEEQTPDPLADEKTAATETVNALEFLSDEEKAQFNEQIESAETADAINTAVSEAESLNSENDSSFEYADITLRYQYLDLTFNQYENREYQTIELVPTVDEEAVNPFDASDVEDTYTFTIRFDEFEVTDIVNVDNANPIPFEVVDSEEGQVLEVTIDSMSRLLILGEEIDQFASIRESAREQVAELEYLDEEQVTEFNNQIDSAETEEAINAVVSDARSVNEDQAPDPLQDEKDAAEETVIGLEYLEEEQVTEFTTTIENAETEEVINSTVSEAQSVNEDQAPDPLQDEKDAAKETVGALEYLDEEQVTEFNNQIDNADSAEGINSVVSEAQSVNDEQAPDPLQDEKDAAKETVAGLEYLDEEQVTDFNNQIDNAETEEAINTVISEAQSVNEDQTPDPLQDEKDAAKETIGALEYLEEEQVTDFNNQIDNADSAEGINSVVSEAQSVNEDQTPDPLQDEKDAAKETVGALEYLDEEQVTDFNNQIDNADSAEGINSVVSEAQSVNEDQTPDPLQDEKDAAKETVAALEYLDEEQVTDFNNQIDNADSAEGIISVVSEAQSVNEDQTPDPLADEKESATNTVSELQNLSEEERNAFISQIEAADSQEAITSVITEAENLNALEGDKNSAINTISEMQNLGESQVADFNERIENAESTEDVASILEEASQIDADQAPDPLQNEKDEAKAVIADYENLSDDQVAEFNERIDEAESTQDIDDIVGEAVTANDEQAPDELADEREDALNTISEMQNLDDDQRADFNEQIENADSSLTITSILEEAAQVDADQAPDPLQNEKDEAKAVIADYENLSDDQVAEFNERIDEAESTQDIDDIVGEAVSANDEQAPDELADEREDALNTISEMQNLDDDQRADFNEQIENADSSLTITSILEEASQVDADQAPDPLQDEKDEAKETIAGYENLDEDQVAEFNERIDEAESTQDINDIVEEAVSVNDEQAEDPLQEEKDSAKETIDALENVSDETKETMKEDIDSADSSEDIEAIVTEAERINDDQAEEKEDPLAAEKEAAKEEILALEYLNEETLALFISQINEADSQEMIDRLVREANETNESRQRDLEDDEVTEAEIIGGTLDESEVEDMPEPRDDNELIMSIEDSGVYIEGTVGERLTASGITLPGATVTISSGDQSFEIVAGEDGLFEGTIPYFSSGTVLNVVFTSEDGETYETTVTLVYDPTTKTVKGGSDHEVVVAEPEDSDGSDEEVAADEDLPATGLMNNIGIPIAGAIALFGIGLFALFFRRR